MPLETGERKQEHFSLHQEADIIDMDDLIQWHDSEAVRRRAGKSRVVRHADCVLSFGEMICDICAGQGWQGRRRIRHH